MFDETVQNLVRAKMAHARADANMRQLQDDVAVLSAPGAAEHAPAPGAPAPDSDGDAATSVSTMARNALTGISQYFSSTKSGNAAV